MERAPRLTFELSEENFFLNSYLKVMATVNCQCADKNTIINHTKVSKEEGKMDCINVCMRDCSEEMLHYLFENFPVIINIMCKKSLPLITNTVIYDINNGFSLPLLINTIIYRLETIGGFIEFVGVLKRSLINDWIVTRVTKAKRRWNNTDVEYDDYQKETTANPTTRMCTFLKDFKNTNIKFQATLEGNINLKSNDRWAKDCKIESFKRFVGAESEMSFIRPTEEWSLGVSNENRKTDDAVGKARIASIEFMLN